LPFICEMPELGDVCLWYRNRITHSCLDSWKNI